MKDKRKGIIVLTVLLFILVIALYKPNIALHKTDNNLNITILKIGKADAIIIEDCDEYMIIDAGEEEDGTEIVNYLKSKGKTSIEKLIITHFDKDHVGGADTVIENIEVKEIIVPDYIGTGSDYVAFIDSMKQLDISPTYLTDVTTFNLGNSIVTIEPPSSYEISNEVNEIDNDLSLITTIRHFDNTLVFLGDAEKPRLKEWLKNTTIQKCEFIKFPHHGIYNTEHDNLINQLKPELVAICTSRKKPADKQTIRLLKSNGIGVAETKDGNIYVQSDGNKVYMNQQGGK